MAAAALATLPFAVQATDLSRLPEPLAEKVNEAREACANIRNGEFALEWGAVTRTDLDGDLVPDWVLDEQRYACSRAVSLFCSTAGCMSHFLVGGVVTSIRNFEWTVVTFGRDRVLVTRAHGTSFGAIGPRPCFVAHAWDSEANTWRSGGAGSK